MPKLYTRNVSRYVGWWASSIFLQKANEGFLAAHRSFLNDVISYALLADQRASPDLDVYGTFLETTTRSYLSPHLITQSQYTSPSFLSEIARYDCASHTFSCTAVPLVNQSVTTPSRHGRIPRFLCIGPAHEWFGPRSRDLESIGILSFTMSESVRVPPLRNVRNLVTAPIVASSGDRTANALGRYNLCEFRRARPRLLHTKWGAFRSMDRCQSSAQWRNEGTPQATIRSLRYVI